MLLTEDQQALREVAQRFARERLRPDYQKREAQARVERKLYRQMGELGLLGVGLRLQPHPDRAAVHRRGAGLARRGASTSRSWSRSAIRRRARAPADLSQVEKTVREVAKLRGGIEIVDEARLRSSDRLIEDPRRWD